MNAIEVLLLQLDPGLEPPSYAHTDDAGADLRSTESFELQPGERRLVGTGVAISLPAGYAGFVHPRSGLAARHGISIVNAPGTVDAGYRGEIKVCLINTDRSHAVSVVRGDRIAQLVIQPVSIAAFVPVTDLPRSARGIGGYGSTDGILGLATERGSPKEWPPKEGPPKEGPPKEGPPSEGTRA
jgi:dUTP diphosphatase